MGRPESRKKINNFEKENWFSLEILARECKNTLQNSPALLVLDWKFYSQNIIYALDIKTRFKTYYIANIDTDKSKIVLHDNI